MSDDIVKRLRQLAGAMSEAKFPALEATAVQAADEIERLRAERDGYLAGNQQALRALAEANAIAQQYRRERDEARREICCDESYNHKSGVTPREVADDRAWNCFKEATDGK
jgi:predicted transcriptional regulator